eukprot:6833257-Alexandrium_andersonii.AAC.1
MSASLVGSEMCIRDRHTPARGGRRPGAPDGSMAQRVGSSRDRAWRFVTPVSYTHLTLPTICSV